MLLEYIQEHTNQDYWRKMEKIKSTAKKRVLGNKRVQRLVKKKKTIFN